MSQGIMTEPVKASPFFLVEGVNTVAGTPGAVSCLNIPGNVARGYPKLHTLPGWKHPKGAAPIALVGGGPSLNDHKGELAQFPLTIACGSSHDWMIENGFVPTFAVVCDPDPVSANYLRLAQLTHGETTYLVATHCDPAVFQALEGENIYTWHCYPFDHKVMDELDPGWQAVGGGCTVGLRALGISIMMGYRNVHFFGFDSCLGSADEPYAYDLSTPEESELTGQIYEIACNWGEDGPGAGKVYRCAGYQLGQAQHFKEMFINYGAIIDPTFHGPGLMADWTAKYLEGKQRLEQANGICG